MRGPSAFGAPAFPRAPGRATRPSAEGHGSGYHDGTRRPVGGALDEEADDRMTPDDATWRPPRPASGLRGGAAGPGRTLDDDVPDAGEPAARVQQQPCRRGRRPLRGAGPARRLAASYLALAVSAALAVAVGTAATPRYGSGSPWGEAPVDDLRRLPAAAAWTLDLAQLLAPSVPRGCLHFWPSPAAGGLVAVGASVDLDPGLGTTGPDCRRAALADRASRVALVEAATGEVRWVHDLAGEVDDTDPLSIPSTQVVPEAGRVLVQTQTTGSTVLVALDLADGRGVESSRGRRDLPSVSVATSGRLQLRTSPAAVGTPDRYVLIDAADLDDPVWEGRVDVGTAPLLLPDALLVVTEGRSVRVDGRTGQERPARGRPDLVASSPSGGEAWSLGTAPGGERVVAGLDGGGVETWTTASDARRLAATPGCVLTSGYAETTATCLDPRDGHVSWTTDLRAPFSAGALPGQVGDDVHAVVQADDGARLTTLDGRDGHTRWSTPVGVLDTPVAASRTVLYVGTDDSRSFPRGVTAYDAATGARLWSLRSGDAVSFWGGSLVAVDERGVATRLVDHVRVGGAS